MEHCSTKFRITPRDRGVNFGKLSTSVRLIYAYWKRLLGKTRQTQKLISSCPEPRTRTAAASRRVSLPLFRTHPGITIPKAGQLLWNIKALDKEEEEEEENTRMSGENVVKGWKPLELQVSAPEVSREATARQAFDAAFRLLADLPQEYRERLFRNIAKGVQSNDPDLKGVLGLSLRKHISAMGLPESVAESVLDKFFITAELPK